MIRPCKCKELPVSSSLTYAIGIWIGLEPDLVLPEGSSLFARIFRSKFYHHDSVPT